MEWELKTKMIRLGNQRHNSDDAKLEFQTFVLNHINDFDIQSWCMFVELTDIMIDEMKSDYEYWKCIYPLLINLDCNDDNFGFRAGMRLAMLQTICDDDLGLRVGDGGN
jgi:hypothetical protein